MIQRQRAQQADTGMSDTDQIDAREYRRTLAEVKELRGLLPICSCCKRVRDDKNYWRQIDTYLSEHTDVIFTHSLCPECYSNAVKEWNEQRTRD